MGDLVGKCQKYEESITEKEQEVKRYEDKTQEEIHQDMIQKRRKQINSNIKIRKYQFLGMTVLGFFYIFAFRPYLAPKPVYGSVLYFNAVRFIKNNKFALENVGTNF